MSQIAEVQTRDAASQILSEWRNELVQIILRSAVILGFFAVAAAAYDVITRGQGFLAVIYLAAYLFLVYAAFWRLPYWLRAGFFLLVIYALAMTNMYETGLRGDSRLFMMIFVIMSLVFFGPGMGWAALGVSIATLVVSGILIQSGAVTLLNPQLQLANSNFIALAVVQVLLTVIVMAAIILLERFIRRAQDREMEARRKLLEGQQALERRIDERTRALQASFQVSQRLTTILDPDLLIQAVVNEVRDAFGYYHAQIYLWDEAEEYLNMQGGTGSAGQTLVGRKHRLIKGRGMVGRAAQTAQVVWSADTAANPEWLPNPLLPETRAEVAAPIIAAGKVLGVLDVQHNRSGAFSEQDANLIQAIANQVGIAIQNAQQFSLTQRQAEREAKANIIFQKLQTANTVEDVLQTAVRELGVMLEADNARIQLGVREPEVKA